MNERIWRAKTLTEHGFTIADIEQVDGRWYAWGWAISRRDRPLGEFPLMVDAIKACERWAERRDRRRLGK